MTRPSDAMSTRVASPFWEALKIFFAFVFLTLGTAVMRHLLLGDLFVQTFDYWIRLLGVASKWSGVIGVAAFIYWSGWLDFLDRKR